MSFKSHGYILENDYFYGGVLGFVYYATKLIFSF